MIRLVYAIVPSKKQLSILCTTSLLTLLIVVSHFGCKKTTTERPNIILFLTDDLGYGDLACYGNPIIKTPFIDQFASEGVLMTDCHSGGTVCSPSRAALLTGRNPYRSGFFYIAGRGTHLRSEEITIAEILKQEGYQTSFWGKWHLSSLEKNIRDEPGPGDQGFDYWMGTTVNAFDGPKNASKFILNGHAVGKVDGWYCDVIVDRATDWLANKRDKDKPFFMYMSTHEPHTPIDPPAYYSDRYDNDVINQLAEKIEYGLVARPEKQIEGNKKFYYGTVSQLDAAFGKLLSALKEQGLEENTLVIFTSDNGPETPVTIEESLGNWEDPIRDLCFGSPGVFRGMKRFPYEGGHRVPSIVRWPKKVPAGITSDILFNGTDFLPTICNLVDAPIPEDRAIDGIDAFAAFTAQDVSRKTPAIWYYPNHEDTYFRMPQMAMRKDNHTLIGWLPEKKDEVNLDDWIANNDPVRFELYDLAQDPSQKKDLSDNQPIMVDTMRKEMITLWRSMTDEGLKNK